LQSSAAIAEDSEQPVPWALCVATRGAEQRNASAGADQIIGALAALPVPPLIKTAGQPSAV
jgi:hypothetical protein